ncbi:helix-turn-helix domain-containing protein [Actinacidiphila alni]|uniref:helix-turn-helix domain-containing protein n=1 Tax=Actinacidiphila alni TaxID=380248 RepID=UPI000B852861|nr:helix-turn-helix transcriptional regulator [Actinacidiphila alni]
MAPRKRRPPNKKNPSPFEALGLLLAHFRVVAGHTQAELAQTLIISESKLASMEQGRRPLTLTMAQELDRILETKGALEVSVSNLPEVDEAIPTFAAEFIELEREALAYSSYQNQVLPGLLQTEEYMRAVFRDDTPTLTEEEIEFRVTARLKRQEILQGRIPPAASFVISEATLVDRIGGDDVWRRQMRHLRECADVPGITIQVLRLGRTTHAGLDGPFVLLETPDHDHLAYAETQRGSLMVHDPDGVSILARKYAMLRSQALNPEETKGLLDRLLGE